MKPPSNDKNAIDPNSHPSSLSDSEAAQRALDYYLKPPVSPPETEELPFTARDGLTAEQAMIHASVLLRCAAATAYESADCLQGARRDLAFSVVHMINMARTMVDRSLDDRQHT